jgi:hypothetical protein
MKTSAVTLFVIGILLAVAAFLSDKAENLPFVVPLLAPEHAKAQEGLQGLEKKMTLTPTDDGFGSLAAIFLARLSDQNPPERLVGITVVKIERHRPSLVFGKLRAGEVVTVRFVLSNGQSLDWNLDKLAEAVSALKTHRLFIFSAFVLAAGILVQILGFILQAREARPNNQE